MSSATPPTGGGRGRVTIQDVAAAAGVSRALVSIVLRDVPGASEATRDRVRAVAESLGYRPDRSAQQLRRSRTRTIGVSYEVRAPFHGDLVEALYPAAEARGLTLALSAITATRTEEQAVNALLAERPEAIVLLGSTLDATGLRTVTDAAPTVVLARDGGGVVDAVHTNDLLGGKRASEHLASLGHTAITYLHGGSVAGAQERLAGVHEAAAAAGIAVTVVTAGNTEESGVAAASQILAGDDLPSAIFAFNDRCAFGVLDVLLRAGLRVPEDVSVMGYDNSTASRLPLIGLTTVAQNASALAEAALELAMTRMESPGAEVQDRALAPELVVRSSTDRPRSIIVDPSSPRPPGPAGPQHAVRGEPR
ncbi:MAG: LacI family DNA-binding transcriptional regulator [Mycetocola sp.]